MKTFLTTIAGIQGVLANKMKDLKDLSNLGDVAGAVIPGDRTTSFSEYGKILENLKQHSKEWRMFKQDAGKIVLEKNLLMNCLSMTQNFFLFRPIDDQGSMLVRFPDGFIRNHPKRMHVPSKLLYIAAGAFAALGSQMSIYFFLGLLIVPAGHFLNRIFHIFYEKAHLEWSSNAKNPYVLFARRKYSFYEKKFTLAKKTQIQISFEHTGYKEIYKSALQTMTVDAHRLGGKISWLWLYHLKSDQISIVTYDDFSETVHLDFDLADHFFVPVIETQYSFIFNPDHIPINSFYQKLDEEVTEKFISDAGLSNNEGFARANESLLNPIEV